MVLDSIFMARYYRNGAIERKQTRFPRTRQSRLQIFFEWPQILFSGRTADEILPQGTPLSNLRVQGHCSRVWTNARVVHKDSPFVPVGGFLETVCIGGGRVGCFVLPESIPHSRIRDVKRHNKRRNHNGISWISTVRRLRIMYIPHPEARYLSCAISF